MAVAVSAAVCGLALLAGRRFGIFDRPDEDLKPHRGLPVPLGGLGVLVAVHVGLAMAGAWDAALFVATVAVWTLGLVDDLIGLPPWVRLLGIALSGVALAVLADQPIGLVGGLAAVGLVLVTVNAVNLLDGLDGLAAAVSALAAVGLAGFAALQGLADPWSPVILSTALVGFLVWNFPPARMFLGDNGAYVIGVALAWAALRASDGDWQAGLTAAALIGIPLIEMAATIIRRSMRRVALFGGDRDHSYDRLHRGGRSVAGVTAFFVLAQGIWSLLVLALAALTGNQVAWVGAIVVGTAVVLFYELRRETVPEPER